ncbi:claudin-like protein ZF-A89 [Pangasianodon hypophthalmus]|uniref:claudin-like protein ZF-A89 n=1 Tax=Pangasianodon hypophthalmus TaxID=310915 RepID=UPI002307033A|nr:claudin-like protein ZF-A89 [Pangasianodon hypophthalmus]
MVSTCQCCQVLGFVLGVIGFLEAIFVSVLPMWKVTLFIGADIKTTQIIWEGLWMFCVMNSTGQMRCKIYNSLLAPTQDLQVAQALTTISIIACLFAIILGVAGGKCNNLVKNKHTKIKIAICFIVAGVLYLISVCWCIGAIILHHPPSFYKPFLTIAQKTVLGASLFLGFGITATLLLSGLGILLCSICSLEKKTNYNNVYRYSQPQSTATIKPMSACRSTRQRIFHSS